MSYVPGYRREKIGNFEGNDRYLVGLMVCVVDVEGQGIVSFDESGGLGFYFQIGLLVVLVLRSEIICLIGVGRSCERSGFRHYDDGIESCRLCAYLAG